MALKRARSSLQGGQDVKSIPALVCNVNSSHQGLDTEPSLADLHTVLRFLDRPALLELVMELAEVPTENFVETSPLEVIHKAVTSRASPLKRAREVWTGAFSFVSISVDICFEFSTGANSTALN